MEMPFPFQWVFSIGTLISSFLHLGYNVSLAFLRLRVVNSPLEYRTAEAKKKLEKKVSIIASTSSLIIGFSCSLVRVLLKNVTVLYVILSASRILAYILLCILYLKLYAAMKSQSQAIADRSIEQGAQSACNDEVITRRNQMLEHSKKFFIGITSSFFVLNLPGIIMPVFTTENQPCNSAKGIIVIIFFCLSLFNMVFDAIWYFYTDRRTRRS